MVGEKKDDGTRYPFKMLLEESLTQQRNKMMDSFVQILRRLPTGDASSSSGGVAPFKVQINFDIPIFEGHIDAHDVIRIWTRGQNLAQKSKFSELPQNKWVCSPHRHEPNATRLGSNGRRMSEISRSVRIVKQAKKMCVDCTVCTDADVAEVVR
jgi:hypothetical protein